MKKIIISSMFGALGALIVLMSALQDFRSQLIESQAKVLILEQQYNEQQKHIELYSLSLALLIRECAQGNKFQLHNGSYKCYRQQDM